MTAEDRCKVFKDLLLWAWRHEGEVLYMEERVYAVSNGKSVTLVIAGNPKEAKDKVRELGYEHGKRDGANAVIDIMNRGKEE